jgi:malate dehydrogenase (oxaloacetate-decarboxylating)
MESDVLALHRKHTGVLSIRPGINVRNNQDLANAYTPGVAEISQLIKNNHQLAREYTVSGKLVAVITDGSAVLGLGNIGPQAGLPIVEGKALLYKSLADVDAIPLAIEQTSIAEMIQTIKNFQNSFGGIHLEDIAAPKCFEIEEKLQNILDIPVYHDDQEGTAIVVLAGLLNAAKLAGKPVNKLKVVINGIGASGVATAKLLLYTGISDITLVDKQGILTSEDTTLNTYQRRLVEQIPVKHVAGNLADSLVDQDVFIGLSTGNILTPEMILRMGNNPIIFALANPIPEIMPTEAATGGATLIATGSSKYVNQVNNILVFPGLFKGLLAAKIKCVNLELEAALAKCLAKLVKNPSAELFIPNIFTEGIVEEMSKTVVNYAKKKSKGSS